MIGTFALSLVVILSFFFCFVDPVWFSKRFTHPTQSNLLDFLVTPKKLEAGKCNLTRKIIQCHWDLLEMDDGLFEL